jgi:hypothetical protein
MKKSEKILSGIVLTLALGLGGTLYYRTYINPWEDVSTNTGSVNNQTTQEAIAAGEKNTTPSEPATEKIYNVAQSGMSLEERAKIRTMFFDFFAKLTDPTAAGGSGTVKSHFADGKYNLYMKASGLPELAMEGNLMEEDVYQGWLSNVEGSQFVMLNVAEKVDGGYEILFASNEDLTTKFPKFVLSKQSLGTTQNGPGAVVLEGLMAK